MNSPESGLVARRIDEVTEKHHRGFAGGLDVSYQGPGEGGPGDGNDLIEAAGADS